MPKTSFRRRKPSPAQLAMLERLSNPRTPNDLIEALKDPSTKAYKDMMNELKAQSDITYIVNFLIERYLVESFKATQKEKEEILKQQLAAEIVQQEKWRQISPEMIDRNDYKKRVRIDEKELKAKIDNHVEDVMQLQQRLMALGEISKELDSRVENNTKAWEALKEKKIENYTQELVNNNITFKLLDGSEVRADSEKGQAIIHQKYDAPPPDKVVQIHQSSVDAWKLANNINDETVTTLIGNQYNNKDTSKDLSAFSSEIPLAPPPPSERYNSPLLAVAERRVNLALINEQIREVAALAEDKTGNALLDAIKLNQMAIKFMMNKIPLETAAQLEVNDQGNFVKPKPGSSRHAYSFAKVHDDLFNEEVRIFANAILNHEDKKSLQKELAETKNILKVEEVKLGIEKEEYKYLTGKNFEKAQDAERLMQISSSESAPKSPGNKK